MILLLYGDDTYRSRRKLAALRERFLVARDSSGINVAIFRENDATIDAVAEALFATPFLAEKKLVILEGFLRASTDDQKKIGDALSRKPESTVVIIYEDVGADALAKSPLFPTLAKEKFSEEFPALTPAAAERFVTEECAAAGAKIDQRVSRLLISLIGVDSWQLHEEAAKLAAYACAATKGTITEDVVRALVVAIREESIFAFLDACADGRSAVAVKMLENLLASGVAELQIIAMLTKHYRSAIAASDLIARGNPDATVLAKALGIHAFPAGKAFAFARKRSPEALRSSYERLIGMERAFKSGGPKPKVSLALFAAKL